MATFVARPPERRPNLCGIDKKAPQWGVYNLNIYTNLLNFKGFL